MGGTMRRSVLLTLAALGVVITVIGSIGLFAALTDTARTGTNIVDSAGLAASADIRLATATHSTGGPVTCGTYVENLTSGFFTVSNVVPGFATSEIFFCIKNVGSQQVELSAAVDELTDTDIGCTGDESEYDTTCGGNLAGELAQVITLNYNLYDCTSGGSFGGIGTTVKINVTPTALPGGVRGSGIETCFGVMIGYSTGNGETVEQTAQSDQIMWRFKYGASLP